MLLNSANAVSRAARKRDDFEGALRHVIGRKCVHGGVMRGAGRFGRRFGRGLWLCGRRRGFRLYRLCGLAPGRGFGGVRRGGGLRFCPAQVAHSARGPLLPGARHFPTALPAAEARSEFFTSVAGLSVSIVFTVILRLASKWLEGSLADLCRALEAPAVASVPFAVSRAPTALATVLMARSRSQ